jgi:hypothetical protein
MSKSLAICVGQIASFKGRPGGLVKVTIMLSSMTGRSVANVRVVDIMPKNIKPLRSTRRYKLVKGRPTWVVPMVTVGPLFYTFTARTPKTAKPGSRWYNVVTASVTGQKAVSRSGPSLVQYISAPGA